jgi:hypothetical protein
VNASTPFDNFRTLLASAAGHAAPERPSSARRTQLATYAALSAVAMAALWGLAAGSMTPLMAAQNLYKVPAIVLLSGLSAIPAGLLAAYLSNSGARATDLLLGYATSIFAGTLVMAALAPLVAIYYHTSAWAGPLLGLGSAVLGVAAGTWVFVRVSLRSVAPGAPRGGLLFTIGVFTAVKLAMMLQLIAILSPILPQADTFDGGIDALVSR